MLQGKYSAKSEYSKPTLLLRLMGSERVERRNHKENSSSISKNTIIRIIMEKSVKGGLSDVRVEATLQPLCKA